MKKENKLYELILQSINDLSEATRAKNERNDNEFTEKIWKINADLEYLTFIMNLARENASDLWKEDMKTMRIVDLDKELSMVTQLLYEALSAIAKDTDVAYRKIWFARGNMLTIQKKIDNLRARQNSQQP